MGDASEHAGCLSSASTGGAESRLAGPERRRWWLWGRSAGAVVVVAVLAALGAADIVLHLQTHEVEDGVLWASRPEGIVASDVAEASAGTLAGIQRGDLLIAVNGSPVQTVSDVIEHQHRSAPGKRLTYTLLRLGQRRALEVSLAATPRANSMYFVLAAVGLFTLFVGASVRLRRPDDQATLHFFWLCIAFFGTFSFSFNGPFDRLDWIFYWGDAAAIALLPPLLVHFTLVFPERPAAGRATSQPAGSEPPSPVPAFRDGSALVSLMYVPAVALGAARVWAVASASREALGGPAFSRVIDFLDRAEHVYLFAGAAAALAVLFHAFGQHTSTTARRQLRWIAWGTTLGAGPFALLYALPWALGANPPLALQLTAVPLGLVPLTFASAIVRYRLRDVEVIIKRGLVYAAFLLAAGLLYNVLLRGVEVGHSGDPGGQNRIVALLGMLVVVLLARPVKGALQDALDRAFYRDRYDYRRALVGFARDLNRDLDVVRLARRLVTRVVETLVVDRMALMLADERSGDFRSIGDSGFQGPLPPLLRRSSFIARLDAGHPIALDDPIAAARFTAEEVEFWRDAGIYYFIPCVFEGGAIAILALGRKDLSAVATRDLNSLSGVGTRDLNKTRSEPFNSEDLALLTAVAAQVATALENGRLYRQLRVKAEEIGRMREFNENILESLDDGLVVIDMDERIVRWNRALEGFYGVARATAIGRALEEIFEAPFVDALRAARRDHPEGATLFRIPLTARKEPDTESSGMPRGPERLLVNATAVPLHAPSDGISAPAGVILLIEDVTERVRLEEQLQISDKMASIGLLAAGVAHEVNTPLTGISSFTQLLLDGADPHDPRTRLLEKIERQTFRAAKIVNGLLNLSRPGAQGDERRPVDLNAVITDVFSLLEHQFEVAKIKVRRDVVPSAVMVRGIEHQLQQVFLNLFLNARDAMPRGGWLSVATRIDAGRVVAEIADTGTGIPAEHLVRIYDPFFTTKTIGRGTGLGLSITYGIVHEHGGTMRCDSAVNQGTRFTLSLPLDVSLSIDGAVGARAGQRAAGDGDAPEPDRVRRRERQGGGIRT